MKFPDFFRPKSKEELKAQVQKAESVLESKILPSDTTFDESLDISKIKDDYKTRYAAYLDALRAEKQENLNTREIQHAKEWIKALNNLDAYIKDHESKVNPLLREKQFLVFKKIRDFLEKGKRKGYIKLPTGTGKTILFLKIAEALDMKTFVASPSKIILGQNAEETEEFTESEFGKYYGQEKDLSKKVTHITYHSLVNAVKDEVINPDDVPVLILDEAHRSLGPERSQTINKFEGLQLAFTATPEFSEEKKLSDTYEEIFSMDVAEAIREGMNCQTQTIHAYTDVDLSTVQIKAGEYDQNQLEKVVNVHGRNMAALELYKNKFSPLKAICNCSGVKHAEDMARIFNENGVTAACITGDTPKAEREQILKDYKEGTIKVLTNAKVLIEGFNEPTCAVTFNLHPTLSLVDAEQRARSGRLDKNNPDKWSYVVDFIDQNSKKPQVLYSEILGADKVWDITKEEGEEKQGNAGFPRGSSGPRIPINFDDLSMDGLKVVVDSQKIMEVTKGNLDSREKIDFDFEKFRKEIIAQGIKSSSEYDKKQRENNKKHKNQKEKHWPSSATLTSMPKFPKNADKSNDWKTFLGLEKRKEWTYKNLRADVLAKGIKSSEEYRQKRKENSWPGSETLTSKVEFPKKEDGSNDWDKFLGKKE